jgi:hypothetical protein
MRPNRKGDFLRDHGFIRLFRLLQSFLDTSQAKAVPNPFMNDSWEMTLKERARCALLGPVLVPVR